MNSIGYFQIYCLFLTISALKNLRSLSVGSIYTVILYSIVVEGEVVVDKKDAGDLLPDDGDVLITCENGKIKKTRIVHSDEHVATLNALFELAKLTGYTIIKPDGTML